MNVSASCSALALVLTLSSCSDDPGPALAGGPGGAAGRPASGAGGIAGAAGSRAGAGGLSGAGAGTVLPGGRAGHTSATAGTDGGGEAGTAGAGGDAAGGAAAGAGGNEDSAGAAGAGGEGKPSPVLVVAPETLFSPRHVGAVSIRGTCVGDGATVGITTPIGETVVSPAPLASAAFDVRVRLRLGDNAVRVRCVAAGGTTERSFDLSVERPVAAGLSHSLAVVSGDAYAFGGNDAGQLGLGDTVSRRQATKLPLADVRWLAASQSSSAAIDGAGQLFLWGASAGSPSPKPYSLPGRVSAIALGGAHALALLESGRIYAVGANTSGQLGLGDVDDRAAFTELTALDDVVAIAAGSSHSVALRRTGEVFVWGANGDGMLGNGEVDPLPHVLPAPVITLSDVVDVASGRVHVLALGQDGVARSWGSAAVGQLGTGQSGNPAGRAQPVPVAFTSPVRAVDAAANLGFLSTVDSKIYAFGQNGSGQLGVGDTVLHAAPTFVGPLAAVRAVAPGSLHTVALTTEGVFGWGTNTSGQLGREALPDPAKTSWSTPLSVPTLELAAGGAGGGGGGGGASAGAAGSSGGGAGGKGGSGTTVPPAPFVPGEESPGGLATSALRDGQAFTRRAPTLDPQDKTRFLTGEALFQVDWVPAPAAASSKDRDGLGPLFHAVSCAACHFHNGRGAPPPAATPAFTLLVRLSRPGSASDGSPLPDPIYGDQLQPRGTGDVSPEARVRLAYAESAGTFGDGAPFSLLSPTLQIDELAYGPLASDVLLSPRIAQPLVGLGLLEAIPEAAIVAGADPDDADADGISGRVNRVWDVAAGKTALGRFGWKANQPTVHQQNLAAFLGDLGLTSALFPAPGCTSVQAGCLAATNGGSPEVELSRGEAVTSYTRFLAPPARTQAEDPLVLSGKAIFTASGCAGCHRASFVTGADGTAALSSQTIYSYTDMLLHDMGDGLADGRPDFLADGHEWRTPPLWGIGLTSLVSGHTRFLHDGRARSLSEAILWHGGEAAPSREVYRALSLADREALLAFLASL